MLLYASSLLLLTSCNNEAKTSYNNLVAGINLFDIDESDEKIDTLLEEIDTHLKKHPEFNENYKLIEFKNLVLTAKQQKFLGIYVNTKDGIYKKFDFKGESTCTIIDGFFGFPFSTSYERDGNLIRIKTDKSDLLLTIKDSETLIGEGWAEGTYIKQK